MVLEAEKELQMEVHLLVRLMRVGESNCQFVTGDADARVNPSFGVREGILRAVDETKPQLVIVITAALAVPTAPLYVSFVVYRTFGGCL